MYAAIRQVKAKPGMADELAEKIKGAVPIISGVSGFMGYYVIYSPDDTVTAISIFNKVEEAEEFEPPRARLDRKEPRALRHRASDRHRGAGDRAFAAVTGAFDAGWTGALRQGNCSCSGTTESQAASDSFWASHWSGGCGRIRAPEPSFLFLLWSSPVLSPAPLVLLCLNSKGDMEFQVRRDNREPLLACISNSMSVHPTG